MDVSRWAAVGDGFTTEFLVAKLNVFMSRRYMSICDWPEQKLNSLPSRSHGWRIEGLSQSVMLRTSPALFQRSLRLIGEEVNKALGRGKKLNSRLKQCKDNRTCIGSTAGNRYHDNVY